MPGFTIDVLLATVVASAGVGAGWWLRSLGQRASGDGQLASSQTAGSNAGDMSRKVLGQLYDLAYRMQTSVGQHRSDVQQISDEISSAENSEKEKILGAITRLLASNQRMQEQLTAAEQRLNEQEKQLVSHAQEARTDALTKLSNRRVFDDELEAGYDRFQQFHEPLSLMLLDVDHFKKFNDTHGHQAGDEILRGVGRLMRDNANPNDIAVRYGGEEFGVIYPGQKAEQVSERVERARAAIAETPFYFEGKTLHVTASAGMAELCSGEDIASLIKRADTALYTAKEAGRNCGHWHDGTACQPLSQPAQQPQSPLDPREPPGSLPIEHDRAADQIAFCKDLDQRLLQAQKDEVPASLVLVRIDHFERIVSSRGPEAAELVLRAAEQFIRAIKGEADQVAPYQAGTLGVVLPGSDAMDTVQTVERLRFAIERCKLPVGSNQLRFTVSMGVAQAAAGESAEQVLHRAEASCEDARQAGGNCAFVHDGEHSEHSSALQSAVS